LEKNRDAAQELYNNLQGKKSQAEINKQTNENSVNTLKVRLDTLATEIGNLENSINVLLISITDKIPDSLNLKLDLTNPTEFINYLKSKASEYKTNNEKLAKLDTQIKEINTELSNIESIRESVLELKQDLASIKEFSPVEQRNLHQTWVNLNGDLKAQIEKLATAEAEYGRLTALVNEFVNAHSEYTTEYLGELNQITQNTIGQYSKQVETLRTRSIAAEKTLKTMQENVDGHLSKKPSNLADDDTEESLTEKQKQYNDKRDELNKQIGEIIQTLQTDDEARRKKQDTARIDALKAEYEKWREFDSLYGDATGSKLSKIAQSFVLEGMLASANHHLQSMAKRYKLSVVPGTLIMKLSDTYNGCAERATDTLSGGESFLVSLALALALADFGQHLGVSTLFIDEGFGTLSGDELQSAINTLKSLHSNVGRQVGIISHREEIRESIPVQISVQSKAGSSESVVEVIDK
jgi:exonuclease SbcC